MSQLSVKQDPITAVITHPLIMGPALAIFAYGTTRQSGNSRRSRIATAIRQCREHWHIERSARSPII